MSDYSESADLPAQSPEMGNDSNGLSEVGRDAMRGLDEEPWTADDGTIIHGAYEETVDNRLSQREDIDYVESERNVVITNENGEVNGRIDTLIEHGEKSTLIDYKTNDMSNWTVSDAERYGREHGGQMAAYLKSDGVPADSQGYILQIGRLSEHPEVTQAYSSAISRFDGVSVLFPSDGTPNEVANSVEEAVERTNRSS